MLIVGFLLTLPLWLLGTSEQKQRITAETTTQKKVESVVSLLDMLPDEREHLQSMLQPSSGESVQDFERNVWMQDLGTVIQSVVPDPEEAEAIARWVYLYSKRHDLSPELILAVIAVESHFDRFAVSNVGARGLMQIMPFWKKELGSKEDNLFNIETNIRYGSAILRIYLNRYGKMSKALAAYNGSLGRKKYPNKVFAKMKRFKASPTGS
ncbi:MAG: lytic transglycosylase domain-containing protein [Mariprofundaceae bacterium]